MIRKIGEGLATLDSMEISSELAEVQHLMPISNDDRVRLRLSIEKHGIKDPIRVYKDKTINKILSGLNRWEIGSELNFTDPQRIEIYDISNATREEVIDFCIGENLERRHFTTEEKRNIILFFLKKDPTKSDRSVAKAVGVSPSTVGKERARVQLGHVEKRDSKGRKIGVRPKNNTLLASKKLISKQKKKPISPKEQISELNSEIKNLKAQKTAAEKEVDRIGKEITALNKQVEALKKKGK